MASPRMTSRLQEQERLQTELELARYDLEDSVLAIRDRLAGAFEWRRFVRRRPILTVVGGLALGLVVARLWSAKRKDEK